MPPLSSQTKNRVWTTVGLILAMGVGLGVFSYSQNLAETYKDEAARAEAYFVTQVIPEGTALSEVFSIGFVEKREVLKDSLPPTAITGPVPSGENSYSQKDISAGQILLISDFGSRQVSTSGLLIPDGSVAISIRLGDVERASPFLRPGNEVAVFVTGTSKKSSSTLTKVLIPRAQIIGIGDSRFTGGQEYIQSGDSGILTLAVSTTEAASLIQATKAYSIYLAIINKDTLIPNTTIRAEDILG